MSSHEGYRDEDESNDSSRALKYSSILVLSIAATGLALSIASIASNSKVESGPETSLSSYDLSDEDETNSLNGFLATTGAIGVLGVSYVLSSRKSRAKVIKTNSENQYVFSGSVNCHADTPDNQLVYDVATKERLYDNMINAWQLDTCNQIWARDNC